jgi:hypothetical protein
MANERRMYKRFQVKDWIFSVLVPRYDRLGKIIDISKGGLSFNYIARHEDEETCKKSSSFAIEVFEGGAGKSLVRLPCKAIYARDAEDAQPGDLAAIRRCGVEFDDLSPSQAVQLESFLQEYTTVEL